MEEERSGERAWTLGASRLGYLRGWGSAWSKMGFWRESDEELPLGKGG